MYNKLRLLSMLAVGAASLCAQEGGLPVTLGLKVGVPVTEMFSAGNTTEFGSGSSFPGSSYTSSVPRYEFGVSGEFHLPRHIRFEVDGLFKRGGFDNSLFSSSTYNRTSFNQWEIPGLFKFNILGGHYRPFVDVGASYRHISTITQTTTGLLPFPVRSNNSSALYNRNSFGGVAGIGMTFKKGPFELTPEARYTRWANAAFTAPGLKSNLDQGDVLLGINF